MQLDWTRLTQVPEEHRYYDARDFALSFFIPLVRGASKMGLRARFLWGVSAFFILVAGFFFLCFDVFLAFFFLFASHTLQRMGRILAVVGETPALHDRYLNGIIQFAGLAFVIYCMAQISFFILPFFLFLLVWLSIVLQQSLRTHFEHQYLREVGCPVPTPLEEQTYEEPVASWQRYARQAYTYCFAWQSRAAEKIDRWMWGGESAPAGWYRDKRWLGRMSFFRTGYQLLAIAVLTVPFGLGGALWLFLLLGDSFWAFLLFKKRRRARAHASRAETPHSEPT